MKTRCYNNIIISEYIRRAYEAEESGKQEPQISKHILTEDDSELIRRLLKYLLIKKIFYPFY